MAIRALVGMHRTFRQPAANTCFQNLQFYVSSCQSFFWDTDTNEQSENRGYDE